CEGAWQEIAIGVILTSSPFFGASAATPFTSGSCEPSVSKSVTRLKPHASSLYIAVPSSQSSIEKLTWPFDTSTFFTEGNACGWPPWVASSWLTTNWCIKKMRSVGAGLPAKKAGSNVTTPRTTEPSLAGLHFDFGTAPHASVGGVVGSGLVPSGGGVG